MIKEQEHTLNSMNKVVEIFINSEGKIRPHFLITGPSGSGKSYIVETLALNHDINFMEINAAQLTKEGTSGNSLSKALSSLANNQGRLTICLVDEFDKLFISGNSNSDLAHETTNGVQNEFLKILESSTASVFGDYGKYLNVKVDNVLFIFAGAFNGEEDMSLDKLRDFGLKTEFLGRINMIFKLERLGLESMKSVLINLDILKDYLKLYKNVKKEDVVNTVMGFVEQVHEKNTLGVRLLHNLVNQYFINGGKLDKEQAKTTSFQKTMELV